MEIFLVSYNCVASACGLPGDGRMRSLCVSSPFLCLCAPPPGMPNRLGRWPVPSEKGRRSRATLSVLGSLCVASGRSEKVPCVYLHIEPYCRVVQGTNKRNQAQVTPYPVVTGFPGNFAAGQSYTPIPQPHFLFVFQNISKMK